MRKIFAGLGLAIVACYCSGAAAAPIDLEAPREAFLATAVGAMVGCALISFFLASRVSERTHVALAMLIALIGGFALLTLVAPAGRGAPIAGALIALGLIGLFKLMNQFEIRRKQRPMISK